MVTKILFGEVPDWFLYSRTRKEINQNQSINQSIDQSNQSKSKKLLALYCLIKLARKQGAPSVNLLYVNGISHNYAIPQIMPHAIQQTHSLFYPHRTSWICDGRKITARKTMTMVLRKWSPFSIWHPVWKTTLSELINKSIFSTIHCYGCWTLVKLFHCFPNDTLQWITKARSWWKSGPKKKKKKKIGELERAHNRRMSANLIADIWRHTRDWRIYTPIAAIGENRSRRTGQTWRFSRIAAIGV